MLLKSLSLIAVLLSFGSIQTATEKTFKQPLKPKHPHRSEQKLIAAIDRFAAASTLDFSTHDDASFLDISSKIQQMIKLEDQQTALQDTKVTLKEINKNVNLEAQKAAFNSIKQILKSGTSANAKKNGLSALQLAILTGSLELVELLLKYKANPNHVARDGTTPLAMALNLRALHLGTTDEKVTLKIIEALIKAGAKVNMAITTKYPEFDSTDPETRKVIGFSQIYRLPLEIAIENHDTESAELLEKNYARQDKHALINAITKNDLVLAQGLIHTGIDLNVKDKYGDTALILATQRGYIALVKALIAAGAKLDLKNMLGETALMQATLKNNTTLAQTLITAGANVNLKSKFNITAIFAAILHNNSELVQDLIKAKANVNFQNSNGQTVLILAATSNQTTISQNLIKAGADVNHQDNFGNTALIWAAGNNNLTLVQDLIKNGANVNLKALTGKTALNYAQSKEIKEILETAAQAQNAKPKS